MFPAALLTSVAAVLGAGAVSFVDTTTASLVGRVTLPGEGAALFAAPDGRAVVPMIASDATILVQPGGATDRWNGRAFPLFFDEFDRMYVVLDGAVAALSYPERAPLFGREVDGLSGAWRAACSADGRIVAVVPVEDRRRIMIVSPRDRSLTRSARLASDAVAVVTSPDGGWIAVAEEGGAVEVLDAGLLQRSSVSPGGEIVGMARGGEGQSLVVATVKGSAGSLVGLRVRGAAKAPKQTFVRPLSEPPVGLALGDDSAVVVTPSSLLVFGRHGRKLVHRMDLEGSRSVVVLPTHVTSAVPEWGEDRER